MKTFALALAGLLAFAPAAHAADPPAARGPRPDPPSLLQALMPGDVFGRRVALTFDDGPHPLYTPLVLEALKASGASATFFVCGRHALHPAAHRRRRPRARQPLLRPPAPARPRPRGHRPAAGRWSAPACAASSPSAPSETYRRPRSLSGRFVRTCGAVFLNTVSAG
jgi:peptidoglycan/xylan/chitin deacetylase (PgdA/CDA1 family)